MVKLNLSPQTRTSLFRVGVGLLLCANYSCSSGGKKMVSQDPFQHEIPKSKLAELEKTHGNHEFLESAGIPFDQVPGKTPPAAQQTAYNPTMPQPTPTQPVEQYPGQFDTNGKIRVKSEWPALPEKTIGYAEPESPTNIAEMPPLPPGGYENPLGDGEAWYHSIAKNETTQNPAPMPGSESGIVQTSYQPPTPPAAPKKPAASDPEFTPAEPRVPLNGKAADMPAFNGHPAGNACPPGAPCPPFPAGAMIDGSPAAYPDEYICDGGDRKLPVHYAPGERHGLDTQDTIAEYQDDTGKQHLRPTNEVCVYAPRFGAVKTVAGVSMEQSVDRALGAYDSVNGLAVNTRMKPGTEQQTEQVNAARVRSRASGLETEEVTLGVNQATKTADHTKLENTNTDYAFAGQIAMEKVQSPAGFDGRAAAVAWTREQSPVIVAADVGGTELYSWFRSEELVGVEDRRKVGDLYIDKLADRADAKPGDVITFTIRYRNIGDKSLFNVQIIDNLTPRLEFIEGSATSDRNGRLVVEDNAEGSLILKWEISDEIEGKTGGMVTFKARVR